MRTPAMTGARAAAVLALLVTTCIDAANAQQTYRWVDKDGRVTYSQNPPPAGAAKSVQQRRLGGDAPGSAGLPYAAQLAAKNFPVTIYTAPDCADPCKSGRETLDKRGIPYKEIVVGDEQSAALLKQLTGKTQVPVLQVGRQATSGFSASEWNSALDTAGYPSSIPAGARAPATVQRNLPAVKLYATPQCGLPCQSAKDLLQARSVAFQEVLIESDEDIEALKKVAGNDGVVPVLLIGGSSINGFDPDRYQRLLDASGFPRAGTSK